MRYFAYGSNLNHSQMLARCPDSCFLKCVSVKDYKLVFDGYSKSRNGAVANIIECSGEVVWGGLFEISEADKLALDRCEGYPKSYGRKSIIVSDVNGITNEAVVYLRPSQRIGFPRKEYLNIIIEGAGDCGLPKEYADKIKMFRSL